MTIRIALALLLVIIGKIATLKKTIGAELKLVSVGAAAIKIGS